MRIKDIPIIERFCKIISYIFNLPRHIDFLYAQFSSIELKENEIENRIEKKQAEVLGYQNVFQNQIYDYLEQIQNQIQNQMKVHHDDLQTKIDWLNQEIIKIENMQLSEEYYRKLHYQMSIQPVLWGDESKLHISEKASLPGTILNTYSGHISVGDYTFAGSSVSILTGSHDKELIGYYRRDLEYKKGFDIKIGNGVWLASNCIVLGPCEIGDNAVVAAGAVVAPGTTIPPGTIFGGVPAKQIDVLDLKQLQCNPMNENLLDLIERNEGVLFYEGWSEKRFVEYNKQYFIGHYIESGTANVFLKKNSYSMYFRFDSSEKYEFTLQLDGQENEYKFEQREGFLELNTDVENASEIIKFSMQYNLEEGRLFIAIIKKLNIYEDRN